MSGLNETNSLCHNLTTGVYIFFLLNPDIPLELSHIHKDVHRAITEKSVHSYPPID